MKNMKIWKKLLLAMVVLFTVSTGTVRAEGGETRGDNFIQQDIRRKEDVREMKHVLRRTYNITEVEELKSTIQGKDFEDKEIYEEAIDEILESRRQNDLLLMVIGVVIILFILMLGGSFVIGR